MWEGDEDVAIRNESGGVGGRSVGGESRTGIGVTKIQVVR